MKAIRRSLKGDKEPKPQHISITPKSAIAIVPPKKVIKALYDYEPKKEDIHALAFHKGDFFHVISREDDPDWYEACNPLIPTARGLVPVQFFEVIGKTERQSAGSAASGASNRLEHDSGFAEKSGTHTRNESTNTTKTGAHARMSSIGKGSGAMVYGIVQYDFNAERPDELEAKAGEAIIVIAQSNPEWFVAKPIGRLGGPGLIPVSFIEIRDMTTGQAVTDPHDAVQRAGVPKVEEWKKMAADYKNSSISLGKFETGGGGSQSMMNDMERMSLSNGGQQYVNQNGNGYCIMEHQNQNYHQRNTSKTQMAPQNPYYRPNSSQFLAPVSASIPRYCFDNDKYWYIIEAVMEDGRHWELSRYYHDFYDFQIALLAEFPEEAGNSDTGKPRTLPFMPGPVTHVTDAISNGRRHNLDEYIKKLLSMPPHISRCDIVRLLFAPREGDFEIDPNAAGEDYRLSGASQQSSQNHDPSRTASRQSSRGQMSSVNGGSVYPAGAPVQSRNQHQRGAQSMSGPNPNGQSYLQNPSGSDLNLRQQASTLTQGSANSSQGPVNNNAGGALKIKIFFQDDIIAIRVPSDISFPQLTEKLKDRLKVNEEIAVQYRDEMTGSYGELLNDQDLDVALQRNPKLTLYVSFA